MSVWYSAGWVGDGGDFIWRCEAGVFFATFRSVAGRDKGAALMKWVIVDLTKKKGRKTKMQDGVERELNSKDNESRISFHLWLSCGAFSAGRNVKTSVYHSASLMQCPLFIQILGLKGWMSFNVARG